MDSAEEEYGHWVQILAPPLEYVALYMWLNLPGTKVKAQ